MDGKSELPSVLRRPRRSDSSKPTQADEYCFGRAYWLCSRDLIQYHAAIKKAKLVMLEFHRRGLVTGFVQTG